MLTRLIKGVSNPHRLFYVYRNKLTKGPSIEILAESAVKHYSGYKQQPKIMLVSPKYDYGDNKRGLSFEENNFLHTLINDGYQVSTFDPLINLRKFGRKKMNKMLIEAAYRSCVDIVFFVLFNREIEITTLREIRDNMKIETFNWFCDDHWRFKAFSSNYAPHLSYVVTTDRSTVNKYKEIGVNNVILTQWGCNHFLYKKMDLPFKYDVSFVGQAHGVRSDIIKQIRDAGIKVETFGYGWPRGKVSTYEMIKIFNQSKINLNFSLSSDRSVNQIKGRDFEIPGCGGFMLTGDNQYLSDFFKADKEVISFTDQQQMIDKIQYYLSHDEEREGIRESGYKRVLKEHTYSQRFTKIFSIIHDKGHSVASKD